MHGSSYGVAGGAQPYRKKEALKQPEYVRDFRYSLHPKIYWQREPMSSISRIESFPIYSHEQYADAHRFRESMSTRSKDQHSLDTLDIDWIGTDAEQPEPVIPESIEDSYKTFLTTGGGIWKISQQPSLLHIRFLESKTLRLGCIEHLTLSIENTVYS